jgi:adenylate kinase
MSANLLAMRLVLIGEPGVGKSTQAALISERFDIPTISPGTLFRESVELRFAVGNRVEHFLEAGEYVPDALTTDVIVERLARDDASNGFVLDGYPRTRAQALSLDEFLASRSWRLSRAIHLVADTTDVISRIQRRRSEQGRIDDAPETLRRRRAVYE